ncbi:MAG: hypothetical protein LBK52_06690, partial [Deltaproteobacteria bacterium]|nr:hypothetical protein [Deltaproteobacteria bacterium]
MGLIWPGSYWTGQSALGFLFIYSMLNRNSRVYAERIFLPDHRLIKSGSLETQAPIDEFDILACSMSVENDYWSLLEILSRSKISPLRSDRRSEPIVVAGGVGVWANPWPIMPFADVILAGEAEGQWPLIMQYYLELHFMVMPKLEKLKYLAERVPGALVPALLPEEVLLGEAPLVDPIRPFILAWPPKGFYPPVSSVVTQNTELAGRRLVEISRGCPYGCRFCLSGFLNRPCRAWPLTKIMSALGRPRVRGDFVGLVSSAAADHPDFGRLLELLAEQKRQVSVSSLRLSALSEDLARSLLKAGVLG